MSKRLEKLKIKDKSSWYFVNETHSTTRYRELLYPFPELHCFDLGDGTNFNIIERLDWPRIKELGDQIHVEPNSIKKEDLPQWIRIIAQHEDSKAQKRIVPTTSIRKLYEFMRDEFNDRDFRKELLAAFTAAPESLVKLCKESFAKFTSYENSAEGWGDGTRKNLPAAPVNLNDSNGTNEVVAFFTDDRATCLSGAGFSYIAREFNPRRTTNGVFENGLSARSSGAGGIDVFLKKEGSPVVGEIKVLDDADPFYALIQCLTYAIEVGTKTQLQRLKNFPIGNQSEFSELNVESARVDICIICIKHTHVGMYEKLLVLTEHLSDKLPFLGKIYLTFNEGNELRHFGK